MKILFLFLLFVFYFVPQNVHALDICLYDQRGSKIGDMPNCVKAPQCGDQVTKVSESGSWGVRLNNGTGQTPIDAHGTCRYLTNNNSEGYFIPFKTKAEWLSFLSNMPSGLSAKHCARPFNGQYNPQGLYFGTTSANLSMGDIGAPTAEVKLPYWETGKDWPCGTCPTQTHTFYHRCYENYSEPHCFKWVKSTCYRNKCTGTGDNRNCIQEAYSCDVCAIKGSLCKQRWSSWSETFDFTATAGDSDTENPSWHGRSEKTGGGTRPDAKCTTRCVQNGYHCSCEKPPEIEKKPINGVCGSSVNGKYLTSKPSGAERCAYGDPSKVNGTTHWTWNCYGSNGGSNAFCSADLKKPVCPPVTTYGPYIKGLGYVALPITNGYIDFNYTGIGSLRAYSSSGAGVYPNKYFGGACNSGIKTPIDRKAFVSCIATELIKRKVPEYKYMQGTCDVGGLYLSPIKVNLNGGDAKMNSKTPTKFYLTLKDKRIMKGYALGGLNRDEGWLMVRRTKEPLVYKSGVINANNWFGDRDKRSLNGYTDLAETFEAFIVKDEFGDKYIPLHVLKEEERKAKSSFSKDGKRKLTNPSFDLRVIDASNKEHFASDFFSRVYVDYRKVVEYDAPEDKKGDSKNVILGRGVVRTLNGKNTSSVDQWFVLDLPYDLRPTKRRTKSVILPAHKKLQ